MGSCREVIQLCKENYSNCLWGKTDWALDLPKLGKASKISGDLRRSPEIVTSLRKSWEVFSDVRKSSGNLRKSSEVIKWSLEIFGSVPVIFGILNCSVVFGNLRKCSGSSEIFGGIRVIVGNLWKSSEDFVWPSIIYFFPNWTVPAFLLKVLIENCPN